MRRRWQPSLREAYSWRDQFLRVQHHLDEGQTRSASKSSLRPREKSAGLTPRRPLPVYPGGGLNRSTQHFILKERWSVI
jgi:hypothetical protein